MIAGPQSIAVEKVDPSKSQQSILSKIDRSKYVYFDVYVRAKRTTSYKIPGDSQTEKDHDEVMGGLLRLQFR